MQVYKSIADVREGLQNCEVAFVPTMGSLHAGHEFLIKSAAELEMTTVVSIFVNPTQFNDPTDFEKYPRTLERDIETAERAGCDVVFAPESKEMYPSGANTSVSVSGISEVFEGKQRPGHFDGVATIVTKLFLIIQPNIAVFGEKDWQQCLVVNRLIEDLNLPISLSILQTIREADGLALSSRNARLSPEQRTIAPVLFQTLRIASERAAAGESSSSIERECVLNLQESGFDVEYFAIVDPITLEPKDGAGSRVIAAVRLGDVRLIDNLAV